MDEEVREISLLTRELVKRESIHSTKRHQLDSIFKDAGIDRLGNWR